MPLPGILLPAGLPCFLIQGHASQYQSPYADVPMTTGHARKRRVCTVRPQVVSVALFLERAEMAEFRTWFKDTLVSGERAFAAHVKDQGDGFLWYEATWVGMYQATALHKGRWRVEGQLLLSGDGEEEAPPLTSFQTEISIPLNGSGQLHVIKYFATEIDIPLVSSIIFSTEIEVALEVTEP